ncbi:prenyltransferase [Ilumatobacter sp.]|uniref:prenyltransferase n=1 Tax=Ilumatobacter sp. TaxID=1967498 RepID=UPI003B5212F1
MSVEVALDGVMSAEELQATADHLVSLQLDDGMIPWFPGGHCDPWNHVEAAMALDVAGRHRDAEAAYEWLHGIQRPDGSWHNYYRSDGSVEDSKLDTNVCAYVATGVWHHWRSTWDRGFVENMWPTVVGALEFVLSTRRSDGLALWAVEPDERPWDYALLTGTCSIQHALRCGAHLAEALGDPRPDWVLAAEVMVDAIRSRPGAFEPKERWAMDWYYPVLTGAVRNVEAKERMVGGWDEFADEGLGIRCVSDEPWITASETAECALAYAAMGDTSTATDLLRWTRTHRRPDGAYWTGIVHPGEILFPFDEHTSYTAAAVVLAVDAITGATPASRLFTD